MISKIMGAGLSGYQASQVQLKKQAARIASAATKGDSPDLERSLVELKKAQHNASANTKTLKSAHETLGTLLDILA